MLKYNLTHLPSQFKGYSSKTDITSLQDTFLVSPSQNVLYENDGTIQVRKGYVLDGAVNAATTPIRASYDWQTHLGNERNLRMYDDELEVRYTKDGGTADWYRVKNSISTTAILRFAEWWDTTEKKDELLFVDGTANIYEWSGGVAEVDSVTTNTITKKGTTTWAQENFYTAKAARAITIGGTSYTYTGGHGTTTLTGVSPDPAVGGVVAGDLATQTVVTTAFTSFTLTSTNFANTDTKDLIAVKDNQVWLGDTQSRFVNISNQNDYTNYTFSANRLPAEGAELQLDGVLVGFAVQENAMYLTAGYDYWYQVTFVKSDDNTKESVQIDPLKTSPGDAALSQELIAKVKDDIIFVNQNKEMLSLGRIESVETPQTKNISDPVKLDFDDYDFSNGHLKYFKTLLYLALPAEDKVIPYNIKQSYWEAPQVLPVRKLATIGGNLYGHSNAVPETYQLFEGTDDNDGPIYAKAYFNYQNDGDRANLKTFNEMFVEGYISSNTKLTMGIKYDFGGFRTIQEYTIDGGDSDIIFSTITDGSLGKNPIGSQPIGSITDTIDDLSKFRAIAKTVPQDHFERQVFFETNDTDYQFKLLAFGPNTLASKSQPTKIKKL